MSLRPPWYTKMTRELKWALEHRAGADLARFFPNDKYTSTQFPLLHQLMDSGSISICSPDAGHLPGVENTGGWRALGCAHGRVRQDIECSHSIRPLSEGRRTQGLPRRTVTKRDLEAELGAGCTRQQEQPVQRP